MRLPSISVIIPTYQRARLVSRAVNSALACIEPTDEVIVVDDGSTDNTTQVLAPYEGRIRYLCMPNRGAGAARNRGIRASRGDLIAFLDSDDEWMPDKLLLQRAAMTALPQVVCCCSDFGLRLWRGTQPNGGLWHWITHPRVGFVGQPPTWSGMLGEPQRFSSIAPLPPGRRDFDMYVGDLYPWLMEAPCVCTITAIVRGQVAREHLRFREDLPTYEDWDFFGRMAALGAIAYLDCATAWNVQHAGPRLTETDSLRSTSTRIQMLRTIWGSDPAFLSGHAKRFRRVLARQHMIHLWRLLRHGHLRQALNDLPRLRGSTPLDALHAVLPGWMVRWTRSMVGRRRQAALRLRNTPAFGDPVLTDSNK